MNVPSRLRCFLPCRRFLYPKGEESPNVDHVCILYLAFHCDARDVFTAKHASIQMGEMGHVSYDRRLQFSCISCLEFK